MNKNTKEAGWETEHTYRHRNKTYDVYKLWELAKNIPSTKLPVDSPDVRDYMTAREWTGKRSPQDVLDANDDAHGHMTRIQKADLRRPIILAPNYGVADGLHRLAKAIKAGKKNVRVRRFDSWDDMEPALVKKIAYEIGFRRALRKQAICMHQANSRSHSSVCESLTFALGYPHEPDRNAKSRVRDRIPAGPVRGRFQ